MWRTSTISLPGCRRASCGNSRPGRIGLIMKPHEAYERVQEVLATVEVLSDPELVEQIRQGEREVEAGEGIAFEELEARIASDLERDMKRGCR